MLKIENPSVVTTAQPAAAYNQVQLGNIAKMAKESKTETALAETILAVVNMDIPAAATNAHNAANANTGNKTYISDHDYLQEVVDTVISANEAAGGPFYQNPIRNDEYIVDLFHDLLTMRLDNAGAKLDLKDFEAARSPSRLERTSSLFNPGMKGHLGAGKATMNSVK